MRLVIREGLLNTIKKLIKNMNPKIWLSSPHMGTAEFNFVKEAFDTNWIAPLGPHVNGFEHDLEAFTGAKYAAALSSGTAALHLALVMLGVQAGDEVICQSFTFSATANPIVYLGAIPVFIDSEPETWNMCPDLLEQAIKDRIAKGKKPKAIAARYEIPVIEDAAEALGSTLNGKAAGTFGLMGVLSFNGNKIITTSGGGALISDSEEFIIQARFLATQARDAAPHYQHSQIGYNYRMSNVCAGIGRGQMEVLADRVNQRRKVYDTYLQYLSGFSPIEFLPEPEGYFSNRWLTTVLVNPENNNGVTRETLRLSLEMENIESRPLWKPMHLQPVFENYPSYVNGQSEVFFNKGLCLPSGSNLSQDDLGKVIDNIKSHFHS